MHLVLTLPGLLAQVAERDARAPHLGHLIALAGPPARESEGLDAALAAHYGIKHPSGTDWPLAAVRLASLGVDPGAAYWLAADPVTLVAGRDDVRLMGMVRDLDANDAATLVAMFNAHFADDGIAFVAARPDAWFVRAGAPVALRTRPMDAVVGRMLRELLPTGPDAGTWRRWQNEIQMLLHEHPVNAARERAGQAPANSVWFSEGGTLPPHAGAGPAIRTFADGGVAAALAAHADRPARAVPDTLRSVLADADGATMIVVALPMPLDLDAVERVWAAPAWKAMVEGRFATVTLLCDVADGALTWTARRPGPWRRIAQRFARRDLASLVAAERERA